MDAVLRFCLQHEGSLPEDAERTIDPQRLVWLREALQSFTVELLDLVKTNVAIIQSEDSTVETKGEALEAIQDIVEDLDNARDLHLIGGFEPVVELLKGDEPELQWRAADVVATVCQNNETCQKFADELGVLDVALARVQGEHNKVATKALRAVSCMVRGYAPLTKAFVARDGFDVLGGAVARDHAPLATKALFLLRCLASEASAVTVASLLTRNASVVQAILARLTIADGDADVWEQSLAVLGELANHSDRFLPLYKAADLTTCLAQRRAFVEQQGDNERFQEELAFADRLKALL